MIKEDELYIAKDPWIPVLAQSFTSSISIINVFQNGAVSLWLEAHQET